jgi:hypothetical protein
MKLGARILHRERRAIHGNFEFIGLRRFEMFDSNEAPIRLTRRQKRALRLLAAGNAPNDVARALGISLRKLSKWRRLPQFQEGLAIAARELDAYGRLLQKHVLAQAWATLSDAMRSKRAVPRTAIAAAQFILTTWSRRGDDPEWRDTNPPDQRMDLAKYSKKARRAVMKFVDLTRDPAAPGMLG